MRVNIILKNDGEPPGKLADAELCFTKGPLSGLKLVGFEIWEHKKRGREVIFLRQYSPSEECRDVALLRPMITNVKATNRVRDLVLKAYDEIVSRPSKRGRRQLPVSPVSLPSGTAVAILDDLRDDGTAT